MTAKVVYVLVSREKDTYTEQLLMSVWSCRQYNPSAVIVLLTDKESLQMIEKYEELKSLISEIKVVEAADVKRGIKRSRYIKTRIPEYVSGPFLYVDADTVFTASIDEIDNTEAEIALVADRHVKSYSETGELPSVLKFSHDIYGRIPALHERYFNGGVMYCRNTEVGREFFRDWHRDWLLYIDKTGDYKDQTALFATTTKYRANVAELPGIYNVQCGSYRNPFVENGRILHFYASSCGCYKEIHPFFDTEYYRPVKEKRHLSGQNKRDIGECREKIDYNAFNRRFRFLPVFLLDFYRLIRWKTFYRLTRYFTYYGFVLAKAAGKSRARRTQ